MVVFRSVLSLLCACSSPPPPPRTPLPGVINLVFRLRPRSNLSVSLFPSPATIPSIFFNRPSADRREDRSLRRSRVVSRGAARGDREIFVEKYGRKEAVGSRCLLDASGEEFWSRIFWWMIFFFCLFVYCWLDRINLLLWYLIYANLNRISSIIFFM